MALSSNEVRNGAGRIEGVLKSLKDKDPNQKRALLGKLMSSSDCLILIVNLSNEGGVMANFYRDRLRGLAGNKSIALIHGTPRLSAVAYDNLSNSSTVGKPEVRFDSGRVYGRTPRAKIDYDLVVPLETITGVVRVNKV